MKKTLFFLWACWLTAMNASAIDWNTVTNIAKGCDVTVSSNFGSAGLITDGDGGSRWQAVAGVTDHDWVLVDLGESKTIAYLEIKQEASCANKYDIYILKDKPTIEKTEVKDVPVNLISDYEGKEVYKYSGTPESDFSETISLDEPVEGQYILFYETEKSQNANTYGTSLWEIYVGSAIEDANSLATFKLSTESMTIARGGQGEFKIIPINKIGQEMTSLDGITNPEVKVSYGNAADITISEMADDGTYTVTSSVCGYYELKVTAVIGEVEHSSIIKLNVNYPWTTNIALNKEVYVSSSANDMEAEKAVNGNSGDRWSSGGVAEGDKAWFYVDLGGLYKITAIAQLWEPAYAKKYTYYIATEKVGEDAEPQWTVLATKEEDLEGHAAHYLSTYEITGDVEARYVKIECEREDLANADWGMSFYEFMVEGEPAEALQAKELFLTAKNVLFIGESTDLTVSVKDQYGNDMTDFDVTFEVNDQAWEGNTFTATETGKFTVTATCGDLTKSVEIYVVDANDKIGMGVATATADAGDAALAIDGNAGIPWVTGDGESAGEHYHWIQVDLGYTYDLSLICLSWEGACPADYKVFVGSDAENLTEVYSVVGHEGMKSYTDSITTEEKAVRIIRVETTKNATGYGIKLFEMEAYGQGNGTYTRNITSGNLGTLCLPFAATLEGATAYTIAGKTESNIVLTEVADNKLEAGVPYIFEATSGALTATYSGTFASAGSANGLFGTLNAIPAGTSLTGYYMINNNNEIQLCADGCSLGANRAYIDLAQVLAWEEPSYPVNARLIAVEGGDVTAVETAKAAAGWVDVYSLSGVRVRSHVAADKATEGLSAGVYIVNGKKYVVK